MKFIEETKLRDAFWKKYNYRSNILRSQFECQARHGGVDLATIERVLDKKSNIESIQFVAFEFKLDDIKKAIAQAEEDLNYFHKAFIVIPDQKEKIIKERYVPYLKIKKYIGVIGVAFDGSWSIIHQPWTQKDEVLKINQELLKLLAMML